MRLKVEKLNSPSFAQKETAKKETNLANDQAPESKLSESFVSHVLDCVVQPQVLSNWCWAAIAASLGKYYSTCSLQQNDIASAILGLDCSTINSKSDCSTTIEQAQCNRYAMLDESLQLVGCYSHWSPSRPSFKRIRAAIDAKQPVCLRLEWPNGGFHYLVIIGYYSQTNEIYVEDTLHGPSVQSFSSFPYSYRGTGGIWRETFWTRANR